MKVKLGEIGKRRLDAHTQLIDCPVLIAASEVISKLIK